MSARITLLACLVGLFGCRSSEGSGEKSTSTEATEESGTTELPEDWWDDGDWDGGEGDSDGEGEGEDWEEDDGEGELRPTGMGSSRPFRRPSTGEVGWIDRGVCGTPSSPATRWAPPAARWPFGAHRRSVCRGHRCREFDLDILTSPDFEFVVGFSGEEALEADPDTDTWETFACAFYEGDIIGWYAKL